MTTNEPLTTNKSVNAWVSEMASMCQPDKIIWCDGSEKEQRELEKEAISTGELIELNQEKLPGCTYHRTARNDVARTEHLTFICTRNEKDAGPLNNWMERDEAYAKLREIFAGSMKGRTMYVVPFIMGVPGSKFNKISIELTDSIYVMLNMRIMTTIGRIALDELGDSDNWTRCLHSKADLNINRRFICHFPEDNTVWSVGSCYGGNVLLGKKCLSLRIGSCIAKREGWMAEHMLVMGVQNPSGEVHYVVAAFPSACGKTNFAMLVPPKKMLDEGWKTWTIGDDIAWMRIGEDGRLWAVNPERGFFGVIPGTNSKTNPIANEMIKKNTIYTNTALCEDGTVWWEGHDSAAPERALNWKGEEWSPKSGEPGSHPNARFTTSVSQCSSISTEINNSKGVPISAIIFGGRRSDTIPLVYETFNWQHGVYVGATMASETTAAAMGSVGVIRHDPMAMRAFIGYNVADYFSHWLNIGKKLSHPPKIFNVNWFRKDKKGKFLWPGFGENLRVLNWMIERCEGRVDAKETPIGFLPAKESFYLDGLKINSKNLDVLLRVDSDEWLKEQTHSEQWLKSLGRVPSELWAEHDLLNQRMVGVY